MQNNEGLSPIRIFFRNKWVIGTLCLNAVVIITIITIAIINSTKTAIITFNITPINATISINGNTSYNTSSTYRLHPGTYNITISHDGLDSKTFDINLPSHSSTLLTTYLSADKGTNFSFYEQKSNYDSTQKLLAIASPDNNQTYDHDTSAQNFVSEYGPTLDAYNSNLPIIETSRENPDDGGRLLSSISIQKDSNCDKYLCVSVQSFGVQDITKSVNRILTTAGLDLKYLEINYATN